MASGFKALTDGLGNLYGPQTEYYAKIATGTYTGDGGVAQAITGVGFEPRFVWITRVVVAGADTTASHMKIDTMGTNYAFQMVNNFIRLEDDHIESLDADGFTVDDEGADTNPNTLGQLYCFIAFG